jgi:hypothetical protein
MTTKFLFLLLLFSTTIVFGQKADSSRTMRLGIIGTFDYAYNFQDKVLTPGLGRKFSIGMTFTNKKRQFVSFVAVGAKGFKFNLYSPSFRTSFINDVKSNYTPINGTSEDSLIGAQMNTDAIDHLWGTYSSFFQIGFILNNKFKPTISIYKGEERFLLYGPYAKYEDPEHGDIKYVGMSTRFYELKCGFTIPIKKITEKPFTPNINIGYKWVDYGQFEFGSTPLSAYTNGSLKDKYRHSGKLTISLSFYIWSNWAY